MDERDLKAHLLGRVLEYGGGWNAVERDIYEKFQQEDEELRQKYPGGEYNYAQRTDWFALFAERISPLFDACCTDKKRVYGGKSSRSFGFPAKFAGIEQPAATEVTLKTKSRAEVHVTTETDMEDEYLFVLLKKGNAWKIDSYKGRTRGDEKWQNMLL